MGRLVVCRERLELFLRRVRRRRVIISVSRTLLWSIAFVGLFLAVHTWLRPILPWGQKDGREVLVVGSLLILVFAILLQLARAPTLQETAIQLDRRLRLRQTLSTARELTELASANRAESVVRMALWRVAEEAISDIRPAVLVPFRPMARDAVPLLLLCVSFALPTAIPPLEFPEIVADEQIITFTQDQVERVSKDLERLAGSLAAEALRDRSQYLEALSQAAGDLAESIRSGTVDAHTAARELQTIVDYVQAEIGSRLSVPARGNTSAPSTISLTQPSVPRNERFDDSLQSGAEQLRAVTEALEQVQAARIGSEFETFYPQVGGADTDRRPDNSLLIAEGEAGGTATGVAQQSTSNEGDAAGHGTQDLMTGDPGTPGGFLMQEEVLLPESGDSAVGPRVGALTGADGLPSSGTTASGASGVGEETAAGGVLSVARERVPSVRDEVGGWRGTDLSSDALRLASLLLEPRSQNP